MKVLADVDMQQLRALLLQVNLELELVSPEQKIPGTFWGEPEAGLIQNTLYARADTPVHSILHETCHYICMTPERRSNLHTNALGSSKGEHIEENAVCFLQILLVDKINSLTRAELFEDMDDWGYSFRLGSAKEWFECDSTDAKNWLQEKNLIDISCQYNFRVRQ
jgi:hypothetical protein